ncbi:hypothetical protein KR018_011541, partial [Drosophila ironensis]
MSLDIEIIVGTYEEFLLGYQLLSPGEPQKQQFKQTFADKSHAGSIKSLAVLGPWVATGGSDDRIFIYDMRTRKQAQILLAHAGTVNTLEFSPDLTHLLSGSADGHMIATRVGSWTAEGDWHKAHAGSAVTHISCHPSSKLALSLGGDLVLNTWNLVKGRVAYKTNLRNKRTLGGSPECLSWSPNGEYFTLSGPVLVEVWDIKGANVVRRAKTPGKPICVAWLSEQDCLVGLDSGRLAWISLKDAQEAAPKALPGHAARVKDLAYLKGTLVTASSSGEIKVWSCNLEKRKLVEIACTNIDCRPTCLGLLDLTQFGNARPQQKPLLEKELQAKLPSTAAVGAGSKLPAAGGFVTIEYDMDEKAEDKAGKKPEEAKPKPTKIEPRQRKPSKTKPKDDSSGDSNSEEEEEYGEIEDVKDD